MRASTAVVESFLKSQEIAQSIRDRRITLVGLKGRRGSTDYLTLHEAFDRGLVEVGETCPNGTVEECRVRNKSGRSLLILEGEELRGAKQNRVVNLSVLLEPRSETLVPVSCVEQDRWHYQGAGFEKGERAPRKLTLELKKSVTASLRQDRSYCSDQTAVWSAVDVCLEQSRSLSSTRCLTDAYRTNREALNQFVDRFTALRDCCGFAAFRGEELVSCELFDRVETFERFRKRILTSLAFDLLCDGEAPSSGVPDVYDWLESVAEQEGRAFPSVGQGQTVRIEREKLAAAALVVDGEVLHFSLQRG